MCKIDLQLKEFQSIGMAYPKGIHPGWMGLGLYLIAQLGQVLVGAQGLYVYWFSVDAYKLTMIAIEPEDVDYIVIHTGERYDFVLNANQTMQSNYWMQAETLEINKTTTNPPYAFLDLSAIAILHYSGTQAPS